jgi:hypothetical protein
MPRVRAVRRLPAPALVRFVGCRPQQRIPERKAAGEHQTQADDDANGAFPAAAGSRLRRHGSRGLAGRVLACRAPGNGGPALHGPQLAGGARGWRRAPGDRIRRRRRHHWRQGVERCPADCAGESVPGRLTLVGRQGPNCGRDQIALGLQDRGDDPFGRGPVVEGLLGDLEQLPAKLRRGSILARPECADGHRLLVDHLGRPHTPLGPFTRLFGQRSSPS